VKPLDTNGAGDMFAGAYIYGITNGLDAVAAGRPWRTAPRRKLVHATMARGCPRQRIAGARRIQTTNGDESGAAASRIAGASVFGFSRTLSG